MKLVCLFFSFIPLILIGQVSLSNESLTEPNLQILYVGIDNHISINGLNFDSTYILSTSDSNTNIHHNRNNTFSVFSSSMSDLVNLRVEKNDSIIFSQSFEVANLNKPQVQLGEIADSVTSVNEIISNPTLSLTIPNCFYNHQFKILNFQLSVFEGGTKKLILNEFTDSLFYTENLETGEITEELVKTKKYYNEYTNGNKLTKAHLKAIKKLKKGDLIFIEHTKVTCPDCSNLILPTLKIIIE